MNKAVSFVLLLLLLMSCLGCAKPKNLGETDPEKLSAEQLALMEQYPEYFGIDAADGLDVYVCQFSKGSFSFRLLPHARDARNWLSVEIMDLRGVDADTMREILATYDVSEDEIHVIPWHHPLSSYLGSWQIIAEGDDPEAKKQAYAESIRDMLMGNENTLLDDLHDEKKIDSSSIFTTNRQ